MTYVIALPGMVSRAFAIMWMNGRQDRKEGGRRDLQLAQEKKKSVRIDAPDGGSAGEPSSEELPYHALTI
jgi:hypothetical protein